MTVSFMTSERQRKIKQKQNRHEIKPVIKKGWLSFWSLPHRKAGVQSAMLREEEEEKEEVVVAAKEGGIERSISRVSGRR